MNILDIWMLRIPFIMFDASHLNVADRVVMKIQIHHMAAGFVMCGFLENVLGDPVKFRTVSNN